MPRNAACRSISIVWTCAALAACATTPSAQLSFPGSEFGLVKELSPEFASKAEGFFEETFVRGDGEEAQATYGGLVYKCAGRPQEYFEFRERSNGGPPEIVGRDKPSYFKRFDAETYSEEMLRAFSDRSKASEDDAIKKIAKLEPGSRPPYGISDYLEFEDGWLVAYDIGEFGGSLIWLPKEGDSYIVDDKNTHDLLQIGDLIYAAQGLDHLSLREGGIRTITREPWSSVYSDDDGNLTLISVERWVGYRGYVAAASSVSQIAYHEGMLVGLTNYGLIVVGQDGVVRYNHPNFYDQRKVVQKPGEMFIDQNGRVYVGGADMIGVYSGLPDNFVPELYARRDCKFTFRGRRDKRH